MIKQLNTSAKKNAEALIGYALYLHQLDALPNAVQDLAVIGIFAETARGYSNALDQLLKCAAAIVGGQCNWSKLPDYFPAAYRGDTDPKYTPEE